jgi:2-hydroxychromene-2-carboxylate isomerase
VTRRPRLYFSFRSPYSWLAVDRLARELPAIHDVVEFLPYWDPDPRTRAALAERDAGFHYTPMSRAKHLYLLGDTKRIAARRGLAMVWPIDRDPWWEVPHLAFLAAQRAGAAAEFYAAVAAARWARGEDVCDPPVLRGLADGIGLDGRALAAAPDDPQLRAAGVDCLVRAYRDDVFGIPYLRVGRQRFWGLDRVDDALAELRAAARDPRDPDPLDGIAGAVRAAVGAYDTDTAGGCG